MKDGFIVIDKPSGLSSHDIVNRVRRITGKKKAGHTGTLDPFATGVLPVAIGEATKAIPFLDEGRKEYRGVMRLGESTDTQDYTGNVINRGDWHCITHDDLRTIFSRFNGKLSQLPPMFSALKHKGTPLYKIARRGDEVSRTSREIEVYSLVIDNVEMPELTFTVSCSRGTYVRTLANDIGDQLGCGAHLVSLQRTASGPFRLEMAQTLEMLENLVRDGRVDEIVIGHYEALAHMPDFQADKNCRDKIYHGIAPTLSGVEGPAETIAIGDHVRISYGNKLLAVAQVVEVGVHALKLMRVFN